MGAKVARKAQDAPGARLLQVPSTAKSPVTEMREIVAVAFPPLEIVNARDPLVVSMVWSGNEIDAGSATSRPTDAAVADPVNVAMCGLPGALVVTRTLPVKLPAAGGAEVRGDPAGSGGRPEPPAVVRYRRGRDSRTSTARISTIARAVFESVTTCGALPWPAVVDGNASDEGMSETLASGAATPRPESETMWELAGSLLVIMTSPGRLPAMIGVKVTAILHVEEGANGDPVHAEEVE